MRAWISWKFFGARPYRDELWWWKNGLCNMTPVDSAWAMREQFMDARQARLDASQDVMTRLVEPSPKNKANKVLVDAYNRVYGAKRQNELAVIEEARKFCHRQTGVNPNNGDLITAVRRLNTGGK